MSLVHTSEYHAQCTHIAKNTLGLRLADKKYSQNFSKLKVYKEY